MQSEKLKMKHINSNTSLEKDCAFNYIVTLCSALSSHYNGANLIDYRNTCISMLFKNHLNIVQLDMKNVQLLKVKYIF